MRRDDYEKAVHAFLQALKERPDDGELHLQSGEALLHLKRAKEAALHLVRVLELLASHPRTPSETLQKICDLLMGETNKAEAWLLTLSLDWLMDAPTFRDVFSRAFPICCNGADAEYDRGCQSGAMGWR
jgi:Flp pilus assembly protein TadD